MTTPFTVHTLVKLLDAIAELTGRMVSWLTLVMVLVTVTVVVLRYGFNFGSIAIQESITYMHAAVFMLGAAYTLKHDAHVRVDIFYQQRTPRMQAWTDLLGTLLLLVPVCIYILISSIDYVATAWSIREGSREAGGLDLVFVLKTVIPVMAVLLLLQGISNALRNVLTIRGQVMPEDDSGMDREL